MEGLTDVHEILTAVIRAALTDQALATGLETRKGVAPPLVKSTIPHLRLQKPMQLSEP